MNKFDYDLFIIGAGSAGVRAARLASRLGKRVAIAEAGPTGGTCVNAGCIPKKLLYYGSAHAEIFRDAAGYGWKDVQSRFDWSTLLQNKDREIERLNRIYEKLLQDAGAEIIAGRASLTGAHSVSINNRLITAEHIIIATGSHPHHPDFPGTEFCISSDEAFHLQSLPASIIIIGGGYIALEFASIFAGLGTHTTVVHRGARLLSGFDHDIQDCLAEELLYKGIHVKFNAHIKAVTQAGSLCQVEFNDGSITSAEVVLYAIGRKANTANLGLEQQGVNLRDDGAILVDHHYCTSLPSVYAIGDVTGRQMLTPVAITEAKALIAHLYEAREPAIDYETIPTCVFSQPNVAMVGLTEELARERYPEVTVHRTRFKSLKHTLTGNKERTLMKLVVDKATDRVLGAHMLGPDAGEIIQGLAIAIRAGATKKLFDTTIGIHPTAAEEFVTMS